MLKLVQFCLSQLNVCISRSQSWQAFLCRCSFFFVQVFIDTIRTFQYQDRITFTCKVCGFLGESRAQVKNKLDEYPVVFGYFPASKEKLCLLILSKFKNSSAQSEKKQANTSILSKTEICHHQVSHHVSELHIEPRRRLEDRDLVIDYIESHGSQVAGQLSCS